MGSINQGNQKIRNKYKFPLDAENFNGIVREAIVPGIGKGMSLTKQTDVQVRVDTGSLLINANNNNYISVVSHFTSLIDLTVSNLLSRIVARYSWQENEEWYVDILSVKPELGIDSDTYQIDDVILGDCSFNEKSSGSNTSVVSGKLVDASADFVTDGIISGDAVLNITNGTITTVSSVEDLNTIVLADDKFTDPSHSYRILGISFIKKRSFPYKLIIGIINFESSW